MSCEVLRVECTLHTKCEPTVPVLESYASVLEIPIGMQRQLPNESSCKDRNGQICTGHVYFPNVCQKVPLDICHPSRKFSDCPHPTEKVPSDIRPEVVPRGDPILIYHKPKYSINNWLNKIKQQIEKAKR